jgi:D-glycero-D-manno-heptose 1,7-bisphosphate phosphatase
MKVAFLDRDGVINTEVNYLHRINDFEYTHKCKDALLQLIKKGFKLIIVTNQAGIAKAIFTEEEYYKLTDFYKEDLFKDNILIHDIFYCPHHVDGVLKNFSIECNCRKPKPGMFIDAIEKHNIDINSSIMVGDKISDIDAAESAGIRNLFLVESGHPIECDERAIICKNLYDVSCLI